MLRHDYLFYRGDRVVVDLADMGEEFIAEALALAGAFDQAGDVHEDHARWHEFVRWNVFLNRGQAGIRHFDDARVGIDRAERIIGRLGLGRSERVKDRRLADVRETYDAALKTPGGGLAALWGGRPVEKGTKPGRSPFLGISGFAVPGPSSVLPLAVGHQKNQKRQGPGQDGKKPSSLFSFF
jgi:hypothetical protein